MHQRARIMVPVVLVLALAFGGYQWWQQRSANALAATQLSGSGTIEAEAVLLTAEVAGRIKSLAADEGAEVAAGAVLAELDTALLEAQLEQARAGVAVAEANLALLEAGPRTEDVAVAEAQVSQARAARDGAERAYEHAVAISANPQELDVQVAQARAARDSAAAAFAKLRAGTRPEDLEASAANQAQAAVNVQATRDRLSIAKTQAEAAVQQAAAALTQAQARYAQATFNWQYVQETGKDPINPTVYSQQNGQPLRENTASNGLQEQYYALFVQAEAALHQAEEATQLAVAQAESARQAEITGIAAAEQQVRAADATLARAQAGPANEDLAQAETALAAAQRTLDAVVAIRENPQQLKATVDSAQAQRAGLEAQLAQAEARLELVRAGARSEQLQAAEAQLRQARAAQRQIEVQLAKATLVSPRAGIVLTRPVHEGEQVTPGAPLMTIGALDTVRLTVFIAESEIGRVQHGQAVDVSVNTFPGRVFPGRVAFIAQQAEFTPRNVQTQDERATTVFAVRVDLPNPDHALKPGMPADAIIHKTE
jgi:multidrug resistance efflux pump